jgi:peptidoglycan/xylan/chitin deacetylase (PgdA/CDA1 family)
VFTVCILYHDVVPSSAVDSSGFLTPGADRYKLDSQEFERHLAAIATALGLRTTGQSPCPQLLMTFDDGGVSGHSPIADMIERYGWRGHFFVTTNFINKPRFLSRNQIRELRSRGHAIGSHSCSHPAQISRCSRSQLKNEWTDSIKKLEDILSEPVTSASIPGGFYSKRVAEEAAAAGVRTLYTSEPTTNCTKVNDLSVLGRYSIKRGMTPQAAASLVMGDKRVRLEQLVAWKAKGIIKIVGGRQYAKLRDKILSQPFTSSEPY